MTNTKKNIDMHYKVTDLENKLMDIEYPMLTNDDLDRQIKIIYSCIQTIKVLKLRWNDKIRLEQISRMMKTMKISNCETQVELQHPIASRRKMIWIVMMITRMRAVHPLVQRTKMLEYFGVWRVRMMRALTMTVIVMTTTAFEVERYVQPCFTAAVATATAEDSR